MQQTTKHSDFKKQQVEKDNGKISRKSRRGKKSAGAFQTISEVASILGVQQHVLRFWESKFTQVKPLKRGGGRRYYRPEDVELLQRIQQLLYKEGYTIKGVQKLLKSTRGSIVALDKKMSSSTDSSVTDETANNADMPTEKKPLSDAKREALKLMLEELKSMRKLIDI